MDRSLLQPTTIESCARHQVGLGLHLGRDEQGHHLLYREQRSASGKEYVKIVRGSYILTEKSLYRLRSLLLSLQARPFPCCGTPGPWDTTALVSHFVLHNRRIGYLTMSSSVRPDASFSQTPHLILIFLLTQHELHGQVPRVLLLLQG